MHMGMELDLFQCMVCGADNAGLLDLAVIGVINLGARSPTPLQEVLRLMFPWLFLVAVPRLSLPPGAGVGFPPSGASVALPRGKEPVVPPSTSLPGRSLEPSQASLMNNHNTNPILSCGR